MKAELLTLENKVVGDIELNDAIFNLEERVDIIKQVIDWQRSKARSGTHAVKTVGEVSGTTKKPFKQKGTGNARQGNARGVQRRGGGIAHGPQVRSHATKLPKKIRKSGLRHALSVKKASGSLYIIESLKMSEPKTSSLLQSLSNFGCGSFYIIDENNRDKNLSLSAAALATTTVTPVIGVNVYDVINNENILISKDALTLLEERLW